MSRRTIPGPAQLRPVLRFRRFPVRPAARRLAGAPTIAELARAARRAVPTAVFDYVDGAAEQERSLARSRAVFEDVEFQPAVLRDVSKVDLTTVVAGKDWPLPFALAPTGFTRMMHHAGERAVVRAANRAGMVYALSTMGTTSLEALAAMAPDSRRWFQLYVMKDRAVTAELLKRAESAGYEALVLTVDTPVAGARIRDVRNGLTIPPSLTLATAANAARHPAWWLNLLTTEPLRFANLDHWNGTVAELVNAMFDPSVTMEDLRRIRDAWGATLIVKGVQTIDDARAVAAMGADAIVVSNHGGRQLDRAPVPLERLAAIAAAVGDRVDVLLDGGILNGADIVAAVALGAKGCLVGRAYLYGLMAAGEAGVDHAITILRDEVSRTLRLLGVTAVRDLGPRHVILRGSPGAPNLFP
jgi:L-lactate dehydrogenase (cytochrome)